MKRRVSKKVITACHGVIKKNLTCESDDSVDQLILFASAYAVKGFKRGDSSSAKRFAVAAGMRPLMAALKYISRWLVVIEMY